MNKALATLALAELLGTSMFAAEFTSRLERVA